MKTSKEKSDYLKEYRKRMGRRKKIALPSEKKCIKCLEVKPSGEFYFNKYNKNGLDTWCKQCKMEYNKSIRKTLYASNKKCCENLKNRTNKEIRYPKEKKCYKCGETKIKEDFYKCRSRKSGLSDACKFCTLLYREENKKGRSEYVKNRRKNDLEYKIYCKLQGGVSNALKNQGMRKSERTMSLVGCTAIEFLKYLESLWKIGMTWENYGKRKEDWSIDHIKPCASFNLLEIDEQKKCFHFTNLQPLWNKENWSKNSWYNGKKY
jgi:hypothetical protein